MYQRILFPVDLHEAGSWSKALPIVRGLVETFGCELHVLTVVPEIPVDTAELFLPDDTPRRLAEAASSSLDAFVAEHLGDLRAVKHVKSGRIYHVILDTAETIAADLIAMASHSPGMADYLIGPNSARVVRHATMSVLVIR